MRWPHESAIARRDAHLARTRRLSAWIGGGAAAASVGLAAALGSALPGHTATAASRSAPVSASGSGAGQATSAGHGSGSASGRGSRRPSHHKIAAPGHAPAPSSAPPVVSSGGS